jgi:hypothetical protein
LLPTLAGGFDQTRNVLTINDSFGRPQVDVERRGWNVCGHHIENPKRPVTFEPKGRFLHMKD